MQISGASECCTIAKAPYQMSIILFLLQNMKTTCHTLVLIFRIRLFRYVNSHRKNVNSLYGLKRESDEVICRTTENDKQWFIKHYTEN
jgi:hypothetical protein